MLPATLQFVIAISCKNLDVDFLDTTRFLVGHSEPW
jgi:hypothetical protein